MHAARHALEYDDARARERGSNHDGNDDRQRVEHDEPVRHAPNRPRCGEHQEIRDARDNRGDAGPAHYFPGC
jgi:hypothetical protein